MTSRIGSITFDCEHPLVLSEFWAQVVGRDVSAFRLRLWNLPPCPAIRRSPATWAGALALVTAGAREPVEIG